MQAGLLSRDKATMIKVTRTQSSTGAMANSRTILGVVHCQRMKKTESAILAGGNEEFFKSSVIIKVRKSTFVTNATHFLYHTQLFRIENPTDDNSSYDNTLTLTGTKVNE